MDSWQGNPGRPITLNKFVYADADPANKIDPSGHMSLGSQTTAMNIQSTLSTIAVRANYLIRAYDTAQAVSGFSDFANAVRQVMGQATSFSAYDASRSGIPSGVNMRDALESAGYNLPKAIAAGVYDWGKGYAKSKNRGQKLKSFLIYMPLLTSGISGDIPPIRTPAKVRFGKEKVPVKIVFGGPTDASGSLFGIGMEMGCLRQLLRMDYHRFNPGHGGVKGVKGNEIAVWRDGNFHYHVNKWN